MTWQTIIPPLLAIALAIWKKEVIPALLIAILSAELLLTGLHPGLAFVETINRVAAVFNNPGNAEILMFSLLIGALLSLFRESGGVMAFVLYLQDKGIARGQRSVSMLTSGLGVVIFIESNLSVLASGVFAQSLFDRYNMSRARLAFLVDSTCAPVSVLILLNAWGAYVLGLLNGYGLENPLSVMLNSIPLNFYAIGALLLVFYTAWSSKVHFSLKTHEAAPSTGKKFTYQSARGKIRYFLLPLLLLIGGIIGFMFYTGQGTFIDGSGSRSILYATCLALAAAFMLIRSGGKYRTEELVKICYQGMSELLPLVTILLLAIALGNSMQQLGTGTFVAGMISGALPVWIIPPVVFIAAAFISFTTGTSWGTFAILIPVAIPVALASGLSPSLLLATVLGGGIFGDHSSPISDSTILSSLASGCDHLVHVKTQLPYALLAAAVSILLFSLSALFN